MADFHSKEVRSYNMSRIRSVNTKPEIIVRKALFADGLRLRLHEKKLPGKQDIVLRNYKTVVLVPRLLLAWSSGLQVLCGA